MLKGKTALVTGSTSGIGRGVAQAFAAAGANVVLNGFGDATAIEADRAALEKQFGVNVTYSAADMTQPDQIAAMVAEAQAAHGALDIVVNNAGIQHVDRIEDFPNAKWDAVIAINQSSAFHVIKAAIPAMLARGWGRVINIASAHGKVASANKSAYVASKHAVVGMTKVVALENADRNITCNAICPGWVLTPLVKQQIEKRATESGRSFDEEKISLLSEKQPNKEFVTVEEIGALAVFLSGDLARSITGTAISIDGGWTAQ
jgi:3-hydroxybutyrate dehydrogenase